MAKGKSGNTPRGFDKGEALAAAARQFRERGFEGVSVDDLTTAMGISRPTLYAAYGGKEDLFRRALEQYERGEGSFYVSATQASTAKGVAEQLLRGAVAFFMGQECALGCLFVTHMVARGEEFDGVRGEIVARARAGEAALYDRFRRAVHEGDLPADTDEVGLVHYLLALAQGLSVQASSGASREALERMVKVALAMWPSPPSTS